EPLAQGRTGANVPRHAWKRGQQHPRPEYALVATVQQADPKAKGQLGDDPVSVERFALLTQLSFRERDGSLLLGVQRAARGIEPVIAVKTPDPCSVDRIPEGNFQGLHGRVKSLTQRDIPEVLRNYVEVSVVWFPINVQARCRNHLAEFIEEQGL